MTYHASKTAFGRNPASAKRSRVGLRRNKQRRFRKLLFEQCEDRRLLAGAVPEQEPDDTLATATSLPWPLPEDPAGSGYFLAFGEGSISVSSDVDWWRLEALAGDLVSVSVDTPDSNLNPLVWLKNAAGSDVATDYYGAGPGVDAFISRYAIASSGTYYVYVREGTPWEGGGSTTGSYELRVDVARGINLESDANYGNDTISGANTVTLAQGSPGHLVGTIAGTTMGTESSNTDEDLYLLGTLSAGNVVELNTRFPSFSSWNGGVTVVNGSGAAVVDRDGVVADGHFLGTIPADGVYYAKVLPLWSYNGHSYAVTESSVTWTNAEAYAQGLGGHLVTVNDAAENEWLRTTFSGTFGNYLWIGFTDQTVEGTWVWSSGAGVTYTNWASGQPNNQDDYWGGSDADGAWLATDGKWADLRVSNGTTRGLVEWEGAGTGGVGASPWAQYLLDVDVADLIPPTVVSVSPLPASGGGTSAVVDKLTVTFSEDLKPTTANVNNRMVWSYGGHFYLITDAAQTWANAQAAAVGGNLALNRPATADATYGTATPQRSVDGDPTTAWSAPSSGTPANPHWLKVDLENLVRPTRIVLTGPDSSFSSSYYVAYKLEASADGINWQVIYTGRLYDDASDYPGDPIDNVDDIDLPGTDLVRYIRFKVDGGNHWAHLNELQVFCGGQLVTVNDAPEQDWLWRTFGRFGDVWIGLSDQAVEGTWAWASGQALTYTNWASGQPGSSSSYDWARLSGGSGQWYGNNSSTSTYRAVIELGAADGDGDLLPDVLDAYPADPLNNFDLREAGADGAFDTADDMLYRLTVEPTYTGGTSVGLFVQQGPLPSGHYRFTANSTLQDRSGNALDGNSDGTGGDAYQHVFDVAIPSGRTVENGNNDTLSTATAMPLEEDPAGSGYLVGRGVGSVQPSNDVDWWSFEALVGDLVSVSVDTPDSSFNPAVFLKNAAGGDVATDYYGAGPGVDAFISRYAIPSSGTYYAYVREGTTWESGGATTGSYELRLDLARGIDLESDANYGNDNIPNALTWTVSGTHRTATIAGTVMGPETGNVDEDYFNLGTVQAGETILLSVRLPSSSQLRPVVEVRHSSGALVSLSPNPSQSVARTDITATGTYYAVIVGTQGQGPYGQYLLDAAVWPTGELDFADLAVTEFTVPTAASSGETVHVTWTVGNYGTSGTAVATWYDRIILSNDETCGNADDVTLTSLRHDGALAVGDSYTAQADVRLPLGISGTYWLFVEADELNSVFEYFFETNNVRQSDAATTIALTPPADLAASGVISPAIGVVGQPMTVAWLVSNQGTGETGDGTPGGTVAEWTDRIVLSPNTVYGDGDDRLLADVPHTGSLAPDVSYDGAWTGPVPVGLSGVYHVFVSVDATNRVYEYTNTHANLAEAAATVNIATGVFADLTVTEIIAPASAPVGQPMLVQWTVLNTSSAWAATPASQWSDRIVLSRNEQYGDGDDVSLGQVTHTGELGIGESYTGSLSVSLPLGLDGAYYLFVKTDSANAVHEFVYEDNNLLHQAIQVTTPNLTVSGLTGPSSAQVGQQVSVTWTVTNNGSAGTAAGWWDRIYLSTDTAWNSGDLLLGSMERAAGEMLPVSGQYERTLGVTVPGNVGAAGTYYFIVRTDADGQVNEIQENDNFAAAAVTVSGPDLTIALVPPDPVVLTPGQQLVITGTASNTGNIDAGPFKTRLLLTLDATIGNADDVALVPDYDVPSGLPLAYSPFTTTAAFTLPSGVADGHYRVGAIIDAAGQVPELRENDNTWVSSTAMITVQNAVPDLTVLSVAPPADANSGDAVEVSWTVRNSGSLWATGSWYDRLYFSSDNQLSGDDRDLGSLSHAGALAAGGEYTASRTVTLPEGIDGSYYILVKTDSSNSVYEGITGGEANNVTAQSFTAHLTPPPDLFVSDIHTSTPAMSGTGIDIGWIVLNQGDGPTRRTWKERVYFSADTTPGNAGDVLLGTFNSPHGLPVGETYSQGICWILPNGLEGTYYILVQTDFENKEYEHLDEGNNLSQHAFSVALTPPPDLQVTGVVAPAEGWSGRAVDVSWTVANNGTGAAGSSWVDKVYLSADDQAGSDIYLGELPRPRTLAVGDSYSRRQAFTLPSGISGDYWIVVVSDANNTLYEHYAQAESNNAGISAAFPVRLTPYADLQVTSVTVPGTATAGQQATFSWTVTNAGTGATDATSWTDKVYLSTDRSLGGDTLLGSAQNPAYLAAGESYVQSFTTTIPTTLSGQYYAIVVTDAGAAQYEYVYENNNTTASDTTVQVEVPAAPGFLHVASVSVSPAPPSTIWAGQPINVTWTVKNIGDNPITGTWDDGLALSPTPTWDGSHGYWFGGHYYTNGPLDPGESYTQHGMLTVPATISGTWYVVPVLDTHYFAGDHNVPRDQGTAAIEVTLPPQPDLQVTLVAAPDTGTSGQPISVTWTVSNEGFGPTAQTSWSDAVYLSPDQTLQTSGAGSDTRLGSFAHSGSLAAVQNYTRTEFVPLPDGISGPYYVFVLTDSGNGVFEHADGYDAEANNANHDATPLEVTAVPPPDLQVTSVTAPSGAASGQVVPIAWTVTNTGSGGTRVGSWSDRIVLSADAELATTGDNTALGTVAHSGVLAGGDSYSANTTVTLPLGISGNYHLFVVADINNQVAEASGESNNATSVELPIALTVPPDLQVTDLGIAGAAWSGRPATIQWTVTNTGTGPTRPSETAWSDAIYLSQDGTLDTGADVRLDVFPHNGALAVSAQYSESRSVTLPVGVSGAYTLFLVTDSGNAVFEHVWESNNTGSVPVAISLTPPPDLQVTSVDAPAEAYSGQSVTVRWTVTNAGTGDTVPTTWHDAVYLSKDQYLDRQADTYLGTVRHVGALTPGAAYSADLTGAVPAGASGPYYAFVITDGNAAVFEATAEDNNAAFDPSATVISMTPPADLIVSSITVPVSGTVGQAPSPGIAWTVKNQGTNAAAGTWYDAVYLSPDDVWDLSDPLVARVEHRGDVPADGSYTASTSAPLPAVVPGDYHAIVRTDIRNSVREFDEANNQGASTASVAVDVPLLPLGVTTSGTIADSQDIYYRIEVTAGQDVLITSRVAEPVQAEFYVRYSQPPTRVEFDQVYDNLYDLTQQLTLAGTREGSYYVLLHGRQGAGAGKAFDITAQQLNFEVREVTPNHGSNAGRTTVTILGSRFNADAAISLIGSDATERGAERVWWKDSNTLFATFELTGLATGAYDVRVTCGSQTAATEDAFTVTAGAVGDVQVHMTVPGTLRPGQEGLVTVDYVNAGETDVLAPFFVLSAENGKLRLSTQETFAGATVQFLGISTEGPAGILPPGGTGRISVFFRPTINSGQVDFSLGMLADEDAAFDWSAVKDETRPDYIAVDAWDAIWTNFTAAVGTTLGSYQSVLCDNANYLSQLGQYVSDLSGLLAFEIQQASDSLPRATLAGAVDVSDAAPGLPLVFSRAFQQSLAGRFAMGPLGRGWTHSWDISLSTDSDQNVTIMESGGLRVFRRQSIGTYVGSPGDYASLVLDQGQYQLRETDGTIMAFRSDGLLDYVQDTNGNRIATVYTGDRLTSLVHSNGDSLTLAYNSLGRVAQVTDPAGRITSYSYDASGEHLIGVTGVDGTTTYTYSAPTTGPTANGLVSIAYPGGTHDYFEYDAHGRLARQYRDGGAEAVSYAYGSAGSIASTDAAGAVTTLLCNDAGQVAQVRDALGRSTRFTFDVNHNLTLLSAPSGVTYSYSYDSRGNLTSQVDSLGHRIEMAYDPVLNRLISVRDARGNTTRYGYDPQGDLLAITYPNGTAEHFAYDPLGNLIESTNRRGHAIDYAYNKNGLLTRKTYADGSHVDYTYDPRGNMLTATDATGATAMEYDSADRLTKITYPNGQWLSYTYDGGGRRTSMTTFDGFVTNYQYDAAGRLSRLTDGAGTAINTYTYDAVGRLTREDKGNGTYTTYQYDAAGELLHLVNYAPSGSVNSRFDYAYDSLGRRTSENTIYGLWTYEYDATGQLTHAVLDSTDSSIPDQDLTYVYDAAGNRIRTIANGVTTEYTTNNMNQYTTVGTATYSYDADGNLTSKINGADGWTYSYNDENRLTQVIGAGTTWGYSYDVFGNLVASTVNGTATQFLIDPTGRANVIAEYGAEPRPIASYHHAIGLVAQNLGAANLAYFQYDALGSAAARTDTGGAVISSHAYLPFGGVLGASQDVPRGFGAALGTLTDTNGLLYMRARFYDPGIGRFVSIDPLSGWTQLPSLYAYGANNPVSSMDPSGLETTSREVYIQAYTPKGRECYIEAYNPPSLRPKLDLGGYISGEAVGISGIGVQFTAIGTDAGRGNYIEGSIAGGLEVGESQGAVVYVSNLGYGKGGPTVFFDVNIGAVSVTVFGKVSPRARDYGVGIKLGIGPGVGAAGGVSDVAEGNTSVVAPRDPNDKIGPGGSGDVGFVSVSSPAQYTIDFENVGTATAPASVVTITDQLDSDLDWRTLRLGEIAFGSRVVSVPDGRSFYSTTVDLRPDGKDVLVRIDAGIDPATGVVRWVFASLDPDTGEPTTEAMAGFLPPNDAEGSGQGHVSYTVRPKADRPTGTVITNSATIVFDTQEPIDTNVVSNVLDAVAPTSSVAVLPPTSEANEFHVAWSGLDDSDGSGLAAFDVYVSVDGDSYQRWLTRTTLTEADYVGEPGHSYAFYSIGIDQTGNEETAPLTPDAMTTIPPENEAPTDLDLSSSTIAENLPSGTVVGTLSTEDPDSGDTFIYSLEDLPQYPDNASFTIDGDQLKTAAVFDYEARNAYSIRVRSTDQTGLYTEKDFEVTVTNVSGEFAIVESTSVDKGTAQRSMLRSLTVTFDKAVTIQPDAFKVIKRETGGEVPLNLPAISANGAGHTVVTLTFAVSAFRGPGNSLVDGNYQLTIDATKVLAGGEQLDGDGNGDAGGSYEFGEVEADNFFRLFGDGNGDRLVDATAGSVDLSMFAATYGKRVGQAGFNDAFDYDGDGDVDGTDLSWFRAWRSKKMLFI